MWKLLRKLLACKSNKCYVSVGLSLVILLTTGTYVGVSDLVLDAQDSRRLDIQLDSMLA